THVVQQSEMPASNRSVQRLSFDDVTDFADSVVDYGSELVEEGAEAVTEAAQKGIIFLVRQVSPGLANFIQKGPFAVIRERIEGAMSGWFSGISGSISLGEAVDGINSWFSNAFSGVQEAAEGDAQSCFSFAAFLSGLFGFAQKIIKSPFVSSVQSGLVKVHDVFAKIVGLYVETNLENLKMIWGGVVSFGGVLRGWISAAIRAGGRVWDWVSNQLGLSGEGGVIDWLKEKATQAWKTIKEDIAPTAFETFMQMGRTVYQFSGLKAFHDAVQAGRSFVTALTWLWENRNDKNIIVKATEDPTVKDTILPQVLSAAKDFSGIIERPLCRWAVPFISSAASKPSMMQFKRDAPLSRR
ncbi:MAG: hypothetical protein D3922_16015, partial [Candidatus Electrothrix sp. AR1]|nr:hypothetical protein [Candidatus Electrothrix sp. AR1]